MKKTESERFKYTQKNIVIGDKIRSVVIIGKKPNVKSITSSSKAGSVKASITNSRTVTRKKCGGCSRKRRG